MTIQPTVMTARNAILASETSAPSFNDLTSLVATNVSDGLTNSAANAFTNNPSTGQLNVTPNQYVYKLRLTY